MRRTIFLGALVAILLVTSVPAGAQDATTTDTSVAEEPVTAVEDQTPATTDTSVAEASAPNGEDQTTTTTPTETAPPAEAATAPTTTTTVKPRVYPRLPTLRVGSSRHCRRGINACAMARYHQRRGRLLWRKGRVYQTPSGRLVRGRPAYTWSRMRREAIVLSRYLRAMDHRRRLVNRWSGVARCESGGRWSVSTGNGFYGGLQFSLSSWRAVGGRGYPHHNSAYEQAVRAERLKAVQGLGAWPHCGRYYG